MSAPSAKPPLGPSTGSSAFAKPVGGTTKPPATGSTASGDASGKPKVHKDRDKDGKPKSDKKPSGDGTKTDKPKKAHRDPNAPSSGIADPDRKRKEDRPKTKPEAGGGTGGDSGTAKVKPSTLAAEGLDPTKVKKLNPPATGSATPSDGGITPRDSTLTPPPEGTDPSTALGKPKDGMENLFDREYFLGSEFSPQEWINKLTSVALSSLSPGRHRRDKSGAPLTESGEAADAADREDASRTTQLVNLVQSAVEKLGKLESEERLKRLQNEMDCRTTEATSRKGLLTHQKDLDFVATELTGLEGRLNDALVSIVGVEQHMAQANARCTRAKHVTELIRHFVAFHSIQPDTLHQQLDALHQAREQARAELAKSLSKNLLARMRKRENAAEVTDSEEFSDGGWYFSLEVEYGTKAEKNVIASGIPEVYVQRSSTVQGVKAATELTALARQIGTDVAPNAENVEMYSEWLLGELVSDCWLIVETYYDVTEDTKFSEEQGIYLENELLSAVTFVSQLHTTLCNSGPSLSDQFFQETLADIASSVQEQATHEKVFPYLLGRLERDARLLESVCSSMPHIRSEFFIRIMKEVIHPFVSNALSASDNARRAEEETEKRLDAKGKILQGPKVVAALEAYLSLVADLSSACTKFVDKLIEVFGSEAQADYLRDSVNALFAERKNQAMMIYEDSLLQRKFDAIGDKHHRRLQINQGTDGSFCLRDAHKEKAIELIEATRVAMKRALVLATKVDAGCMIKRFLCELVDRLANFAREELGKMLTVLRGDTGSWLKPFHKPLQAAALTAAGAGPGGAPPVALDAVSAGLELVLWFQKLFIEYDKLAETQSQALLSELPTILAELDAARDSKMPEIDQLTNDIVKLCANGIVTKSLAILMTEQKREDFRPRNNNAQAQNQGSPAPSAACAWFCSTLNKYLSLAAPFFASSGVQLADQEDSANGNGSPEEEVDIYQSFLAKSFGYGAHSDSLGGSKLSNSSGAGSGTGGGSKLSATEARSSDITPILKQMFIGDYTASTNPNRYGVSFTRLVGVGLYRGLMAHYRSFAVNDSGALVVKLDIQEICKCVSPYLCKGDSEDHAINEALFSLLKEVANLLIVPMDLIRNVKASGYLKMLTPQEREVLQRMREDVREGYKKIER